MTDLIGCGNGRGSVLGNHASFEMPNRAAHVSKRCPMKAVDKKEGSGSAMPAAGLVSAVPASRPPGRPAGLSRTPTARTYRQFRKPPGLVPWARHRCRTRSSASHTAPSRSRLGLGIAHRSVTRAGLGMANRAAHASKRCPIRPLNKKEGGGGTMPAARLASSTPASRPRGRPRRPGPEPQPRAPTDNSGSPRGWFLGPATIAAPDQVRRTPLPYGRGSVWASHAAR